MNQFITLLKHQKDAFEEYYGARLNQDIRRAMNDMLHCKSGRARYSRWHCGYCLDDLQQLAPCGNRNCSQCLHQTTRN